MAIMDGRRTGTGSRPRGPSMARRGRPALGGIVDNATELLPMVEHGHSTVFLLYYLFALDEMKGIMFYLAGGFACKRSNSINDERHVGIVYLYLVL